VTDTIIFIVAGKASGNLHAANLVKELEPMGSGLPVPHFTKSKACLEDIETIFNCCPNNHYCSTS
jgi:hypothetical protein